MGLRRLRTAASKISTTTASRKVCIDININLRLGCQRSEKPSGFFAAVSLRSTLFLASQQRVKFGQDPSSLLVRTRSGVSCDWPFAESWPTSRDWRHLWPLGCTAALSPGLSGSPSKCEAAPSISHSTFSLLIIYGRPTLHFTNRRLSLSPFDLLLDLHTHSHRFPRHPCIARVIYCTSSEPLRSKPAGRHAWNAVPEAQVKKTPLQHHTHGHHTFRGHELLATRQPMYRPG